MQYYIDRGVYVNLARNILSRDISGVSEKGLDTLAKGILEMDEFITGAIKALEPKIGTGVIAQVTWSKTGRKSKTWVKKKK